MNLIFKQIFELIDSSEEYKGLKHRIIGKKIDSVVTVSDMVVKFPKTFIYENTNNVQRKEIKIGSVQQNKSLKWEFIIPEEMVKEGVFKIVNKKGNSPLISSSSKMLFSAVFFKAVIKSGIFNSL